MIALRVGGLGKLRLLHMKAHVKPSTQITRYMAMAKRISLIELNFPEALPNRIEQGMATICVTSRAMIIPVVSRPKLVP